MNNNGKRIMGKLMIGAAAGVALLALVGGSVGQEVPVGNGAGPATKPAAKSNGAILVADGVGADGKLELMVNKTAVVNTRVPYRRVSVGAPEVADVNTIGPTSLLVTAKKAGTTQLILWDDADRSQAIDVTVGNDLAALQEQMKKLFPDAEIEVTGANGSIALRGRVPALQIAEQAEQMATPYVPQGGKVLNFLEISGGQQVMLKVRFAEVSRSANQSLGVSFSVSDGIFSYGSIHGPNGDPIGGLRNREEVDIASNANHFARGEIGSTEFELFVEAMRENNLLRMLAEPNLIAVSGQEASFLAGGEFPVPVPQSGNGGGTVITIEYREFGVRLKFTPVVLGNGKIRMKVNPEVSDLDFSTAVQFSGFVSPGLTKRSVSTTVELGEGQTFAIAGLLNQTVNANKNATPLLGDLPIIGALFRSTRYQRRETELVVLVTPVLVSPMNPAQVPALPGEAWRHPNDLEFYLGADLGGPAAGAGGMGSYGAAPATQPVVAGPPRRYRGQYGFVPVADVAAGDAGGE